MATETKETVHLEWNERSSNDCMRECEIELDGFTVKLQQVYDESPDTSWLGEFSETAGDNCLKMDPDNLPGERRDWRNRDSVYFNPGNGFYDLPRGKHGGPNAEARKYAVQDRDRLLKLYRGDFCFIGITAEVEIPDADHGDGSKHVTGVTLGRGSLWGIESDSEQSYIDETALSIAREAVRDAKRNGAAICSKLAAALN